MMKTNMNQKKINKIERKLLRVRDVIEDLLEEFDEEEIDEDIEDDDDEDHWRFRD